MKPIDQLPDESRMIEGLATSLMLLEPPAPRCPICYAEIDEWCDCGCYADIMYGKD